MIRNIKICFKLSIKSRKDNIKTPRVVQILGMKFQKTGRKKKGTLGFSGA
jgi:hypothetical protein